MSRLAAVVAIAAWLAGCAVPADRPDANMIQPAPASLPQPRISPVPLTVGVYYSQEFAQQPVADRAMSGISHRPGTASVALFDRVLEAAFEQVLRLPAWPPPAGAERPAVIFVPRFAGIATVQTPGSTARLLEYAIEVYSPSAERIDSWTIYAKSRRDGPWSAQDDPLYPAALRDAAAQLLTSVTTRPALKPRFPAAVPAAAGTRSRSTPAGAVRVSITSPLEAAEARERAGETRCVAEALAQANPDASVIPLEEIQDELFPWFEHANLADTSQRMVELMRLAPVREGLSAARLDYIAFLHTERTSERNPETIRCDTTYRAYGCSGVRGDALKSRVQVSLWNLKRYSMSARFETESAGSATFSGVVVPIPGQQSSPASACARAGDTIGRLVGGG